MEEANDALMTKVIEYINDKDIFTLEDLAKELGGTSKALEECLNALLSRRRLVLMSDSANGATAFTVQSEEEASKYVGLSQDHMIVLQEIKASKSKGIFKKDLKRATNLSPATINRVLKALESRRLIRAFKTVTSKTMNLYVMYDQQPAREHTGGPWYTDQEFDQELVKTASQVTLVLLGSELNTIEEVAGRAMDMKILNVELSVDDFENLFFKLQYEGAIELVPNQSDALPTSKKHWRKKEHAESLNHLDEVPCGLCPVQKQCHLGGVVSPLTCKYMETWLNGSLEF